MEISIDIILVVLVFIGLLQLSLSIFFRSNRSSTDATLLQQTINSSISKLEEQIKIEFKINRTEMARSSKDAQELVGQQLSLYGQNQNVLLNNFQKQLAHLTVTNQAGFNESKESLTKSLYQIRTEVQQKLQSIQKDNAQQLEKMRATVDEKLHKTLEDRLGKSFQLVSKHLAEVQKGLGEMQNLATGVGDLKKVLTNVKTRGVMGEIQLGNILEQVLTPDQYSLNVATIPDSKCHVEFAIKLPGRSDDDRCVWLPIDSKFPMDRYEQVQDAYDIGDVALINKANKDLYNTIKFMAKDIKEKYISPPHTTDFGILFLPTEGLYADVVRQSELVQTLQRDYKIILAGPTNLAALLNSLQMGFRSVAIEKRSSEVWKVLGMVKTEFGKFGAVIDKVQTKLRQASDTIDKVGVRSRAIERNLKSVEAMPANDEMKALPFDDAVDMKDFELTALT